MIKEFLEELDKNNWELNLEQIKYREDCPYIEFDIKRDKKGNGRLVSICTLLNSEELDAYGYLFVNSNKRYYCLYNSCPIRKVNIV